MKNICRTLLGAAMLAGGLSAQALGLEGIIVEDYYTISAADADYLNNTAGVTYPMTAGTKVYRIYVDMAPNYKLNTVNGSPIDGGTGVSPNPLDFTTTTTFWNEDGFGTEVPPQTSRFDDGAAFDSYITIGVTGRSGGTVGCGANTQHVGVLKTADPNGNLTLCSVYSGFPAGAGTPDGNIVASPTLPALTYNLGGLIDFAALQADGNQLVVIGDAWATLPNSVGQDPTGTNRQMIAQLTTDGDLSFHINVQLQDPNGNLETYVWNQAGAGEVVSPFLTYPQAGTPDCLGVIGGPALPGTACNDNNACTINDLWSASCVCEGTVEDADGDGICNANDNCPNLAGVQGDACNDNNACTINDVITAACVCAGTVADADADGICDANDNCPNLAGVQGDACNDNDACTINDVITAACVCAGTVADADGDGICDANDNCPNLAGEQGDACNDGNVCTTNDVITAACVCAGTVADADGDGICDANDNCPNLAGEQGDACNDNNACTLNDVITAACVCAGTVQDTDGDGVCDANDACPFLADLVNGDPCDDGNAATVNDVVVNCVCAGTLPNDCNGVPGGPAQPGTTCDDSNVCTVNDVYSANCVCAGTLVDTDNDGICDANDSCPNLAGEQGDACDDNNANTTGDVIGANCVCAGVLANDCEGVPGGPAQPGTACNDNNACTVNDVYSANCVCAGTVVDTDSDGICDANDNCPNLAGQQGDACDDNNANTTGDVIGTNCVCAGVLANDCLGVPGGPAQPGTACDDGDATTGNDVWSANCVCAGELIDCEGVAGGVALPGTPCNDGDACTVNDIYDVDCSCAGTFQDTDGDGVCNASDNCPNVTGQVGSACDDGNQNTENDVLNANCQCAGTPVGGCTENLTLTVKLDGNPTETTWQLWDGTETNLLQSGGFTAGQANSTVNVPICVPQGCYHVRVLDSGNNGITNGGYVLRDQNNRRIIDASLGSFTSVSRIDQNANRSFCVPIGALNILGVSCDVTRPRTSPVYCNSQPGAAGYQFWIYDPHGTYNRRVLKTTNSLVPSTLNVSPVPVNVDLNVRVRPLIGQNYGEFGPACRIRFSGPSGRDMDLITEGTAPVATLYPNPNRDGQVTVRIEGIDAVDATPAVIEVFDLMGRSIRTEQAIAADGVLNHGLELGADLNAGIYLVSISIGEERYTQRLIKQ